MEPMRRIDLHLDVAVYAGLLAEQLRQSGLDEERVALIVSDVAAHVEATGESPVEAFGQPADYAKHWVEPLTARRIGLRILAGCVGVTGVFGVVYAMTTDVPWDSGRSVTRSGAVLVAGYALLAVVLPWTVDLWLGRRAARSVDRRHVPPWAVRAVVLLTGMVVIAGPGDLLGLKGASPTLFVVPRWVLLAGGLLAIPLYLLFGEPRGRRSLPRPPRPGANPTRWWGRARAELMAGLPERRR